MLQSGGLVVMGNLREQGAGNREKDFFLFPPHFPEAAQGGGFVAEFGRIVRRFFS